MLETASLAAPALAAVRNGETYCGVIYPYAPPTQRGITVTAVGVHSDPDTLAHLAKLVDADTITPRVARYPVNDAVPAHRHLATRGTRGDVVLQP